MLVGALLLCFAPIGMFWAAASHDSPSDYDDGNTYGNTPSAAPAPGGPRPVLETANNPIVKLAVPLPHIRCDLPAWQSTPEAAERYFQAALPCLERVWKPIIERAGLPYRSPGLAFPTGRYWNSPCGTVGPGDKAAAFYCSGNNTLYMPFEGLGIKQVGDNHAAYLTSFAHEYGHHVQNTSGIMEAWLREAYQSGGTDTDAGLELSRRSELQANCFAGMFLSAVSGPGSVNAADATAGIDDRFARGDAEGQRRDHGSPDHYGEWTARGYERNNTTSCNTWSAPPSDVS